MEPEAISSDSDLVTLDIEGTKIQCNRTDLTKNSDYFVAMFEGDFVEKNQNIITLKGVKPEAMKIILNLLYDTEFTIPDEDALSVLQAACMLQFLEIKKTCSEQMKRNIKPDNCLSVWILAEHLDLKEICYKAKLLSLLEFEFIKNSEEQYFLELDLDSILSYLGNVNLQCTNEFHVYEMLSTWYENCETKNEDTLRKLLHCVNYTTLTEEEMDIIINSQCVTEFEAIADCLKCVKALKNGDNLSGFKDEYVELANKLLSAKDRNFSGLPCILIDNAQKKLIPRTTVLYQDKYKRKRKYSVLDESTSADYFVVYCDLASQTLKKLFAIGVSEKLEGFKMIGYKNFVFICGGEFQIGQGGWNYDFHIYDVINDTWIKKRSPHARRHFESCICGDKVFIVGGTGPYRVVQKNMFWYNFVTGKFSSLEMLPRSIIEIKCCQFQGELFILNINSKRGHFFNSQRREWTTLKIVGLNEKLVYSDQITVFSYKNSIYVKYYFPGYHLHEMKIKDGQLVLTNTFELPQIDSNISYQTETVLIADTLCALNKEWAGDIHGQRISLELFNINTKERSKCLQKKINETLDVDGEEFRFRSSALTIFSLFHPDLVVKNDLINVW